MPRTVWTLGLVSLLMDASSEMVHSLLPLFLTVTLGASVGLVGLIDGIAEATAAIGKVPSGWISDRIGRRKPLILFGYGLAAASKPLFAIAAGPLAVLAARFVDRAGKGFRGSARDALIADVTAPEMRGRAYGLRQALDTVGGLIGPLIALALMWLWLSDIRAVLWIAVIPAVLAVGLILFGVGEAPEAAVNATNRQPLRFRELGELPRSFWAIVAVSSIFTLARFSEAFLILKARDEGLPLALAPLVLAAMSAVYAMGAYPAGALADRTSPRRVLMLGLVTLIGGDLLMGLGHGLPATFLGVALWGAHMALTQGLFSHLVAGSAPDRLRGSAFGIFYLATGLAALAASVIAGQVWDRFGPGATFLVGAGFAAATLLALGGGALAAGRFRPA